MPITKCIGDKTCVLCNFNVENPRIWTFTCNSDTYMYTICNFCTFPCHKCNCDIITSQSFAIISLIKKMDIVLCIKCVVSK